MLNKILLYYLSGILFLNLSINFFIVSMYFLINKFSLFIEWSILSINSVNLNMLIYLDWMTMIFIFTVMLISSMIMFYCVEYMSHDNYMIRFFYLMLLFILSMILMIISPNMVSILLGWDGLGLVSYCLVIFYQNYYSYNCGMLTVLLNRFGDVMIILTICLMFTYGSWNFMNLSFKDKSLIFFFVIIASFTKSAQFPFSSWLPSAMAAPTPVSSLVHSSTLVTAGIYLLIRFNYLIYKSIYLNYIMFTGLITMLMAGFSAIFEYDMKKIIAFSTLSQLGLMMMIYSFKMLDLTFFHLIIHAMFKSMMFMCSGIYIHSNLNYQDIRMFGKMMNYMPLTSMMLLISNLSLCGLPFMSGFFSKDQILEVMFMMNLNFIMMILLLLSTMLTLLYSFRLIYYMMNYNFNFFSLMKIKDILFMNYSMMILMILSIFFGWILNWIMFSNIEYIYLMLMEKNLILMICLISIMLTIFLKGKNWIYKKLYMYYFGKMYFLYNLNNLLIYLPLNLGKFYFTLMDKGYLNLFFENLFYYFLKKLNLEFLMKNFLIIMISMILYLIMIMYLFI